MNKPVTQTDLLEAEPAPSSLAPKAVAKRNNKPPAQAGGEVLLNPGAEVGAYIDHRPNGGPLLQIPESELKHVDRIGAELRAEEEREPSKAAQTLMPRLNEVYYELLPCGSLRLCQANWPGEDSVIEIESDYVMMFIDRLTDAVGIPSLP